VRRFVSDRISLFDYGGGIIALTASTDLDIGMFTVVAIYVPANVSH
jgi:hypothetical protein